MGVGYRVHCMNCGYYRDILIGGGMLPPEHFREPILEGHFGQDAKEILEEHPDWHYYIEH